MTLIQSWEFNVLGVYDFNSPGNLADWFNLIRTRVKFVQGDFVEAGVFRGRSFLGTSLLLSELEKTKVIESRRINYGFDSFRGFPPIYSPKDSWHCFKNQFEEGKITKEHYSDVLKNWRYISDLKNITEPESRNLSTSGDFSENSIDALKMKINILGLGQNTKIVDGPFSETLIEKNLPKKVAGVLFDCDLYESYKLVLDVFWPRLVPGGWFYFDEYYSLKFPGARTAVDEFFADKGNQMIWNHTKRPREFERHWIIKK